MSRNHKARTPQRSYKPASGSNQIRSSSKAMAEEIVMCIKIKFSISFNIWRMILIKCLKKCKMNQRRNFSRILMPTRAASSISWTFHSCMKSIWRWWVKQKPSYTNLKRWRNKLLWEGQIKKIKLSGIKYKVPTWRTKSSREFGTWWNRNGKCWEKRWGKVSWERRSKRKGRNKKM